MKEKLNDAVDWVTENFVLRYFGYLVGIVIGVIIFFPYNLLIHGVGAAFALAAITFVASSVIIIGIVELVSLWEMSL